jgi:hypothetical protein
MQFDPRGNAGVPPVVPRLSYVGGEIKAQHVSVVLITLPIPAGDCPHIIVVNSALEPMVAPKRVSIVYGYLHRWRAGLRISADIRSAVAPICHHQLRDRMVAGGPIIRMSAMYPRRGCTINV